MVEDLFLVFELCFFNGVINILDEFFIRCSDLLINFITRIIDLIILFLNKFNYQDNDNNSPDSNGGNNIKNGIDFDKNRIFKINNFLKNDSIFEELENRYSNNPSSNILNSSKQSQNIFTSLKNGDYENNAVDENNYGGEGSLDYEINELDKNGLNGLKLNDNSNFIEKIEEKIISFLLNNKLVEIDESNIYDSILKMIALVFLILIIISSIIAYFVSMELGLAIFISFLLVSFAIFYYPKIKKQNDSSSFSKELPYALRQLATELKSGKSLFDSLESVVDSDYGVLSLEFSRVLEEIKYGENTENAFLNLEKRVDSKALSRAIYEILTSLRIGANLSRHLSIIAEDVSFDMRMKLKEYSEKLNAFIMIYTFLAILAPVILLTILLAASVVIGDLVPGDLILVLYSVFFPMIIVFLAFAIKKLEPQI